MHYLYVIYRVAADPRRRRLASALLRAAVARARQGRPDFIRTGAAGRVRGAARHRGRGRAVAPGDRPRRADAPAPRRRAAGRARLRRLRAHGRALPAHHAPRRHRGRGDPALRAINASFAVHRAQRALPPTSPPHTPSATRRPTSRSLAASTTRQTTTSTASAPLPTPRWQRAAAPRQRLSAWCRAGLLC